MGPVLPQVETRPSGDNLHDLVESISGRVKLKAFWYIMQKSNAIAKVKSL